MRLVFLIIATVAIIVFLVMLFKGAQYDYMMETLSDDFPMTFVYGCGMALQELPQFKLQGKLGDDLRGTTALYFSRKYSEFYARIIWAQMLSFPLLSIGIFFVFAGIVGGDMGAFFAGMGVITAFLSAYYFYSLFRDRVKERKDACEREFPNAISKLALIVNSGVILHDAWKMVAYGKEGEFYTLMKKSCEAMDNGTSDIDAIYEFGVQTNSEDVKKFTSALIQGVERGGGDIPQFLVNQSAELWEFKRQYLLQKGEVAAGALLAPIGLMFGGIMLIIIAAAMQSFAF